MMMIVVVTIIIVIITVLLRIKGHEEPLPEAGLKRPVARLSMYTFSLLDSASSSSLARANLVEFFSKSPTHSCIKCVTTGMVAGYLHRGWEGMREKE